MDNKFQLFQNKLDEIEKGYLDDLKRLNPDFTSLQKCYGVTDRTIGENKGLLTFTPFHSFNIPDYIEQKCLAAFNEVYSQENNNL